MTKPTTVTEDIDSFPIKQKAKLEELRDIIRSALPKTDETLKWGNSAFLAKDGMILIIFAGYKHHINLVVTPSAKEAFKDTLKGYVTGKGSVQLSYDKELPKKLISNIVSYRAEEYRIQGVKWK